ncbi:MAG: hypothetical protein OXI92_07660 [Acidobacteriota bacterium]|nr:hypothetical protein [Acidobacteriota bacterium]
MDEPAVQGVDPLIVAKAKLEAGSGIRLEHRESGSGSRRFLHEQGEFRPQPDGLDADFDSRFGVPKGQQPTDRGRLGLDLDPASPNSSRTGAFQDSTAQRRNLQRHFGIEQIQDRPCVRVVDFHPDFGGGVRVDVAEDQLHRPSPSIQVIREVQNRRFLFPRLRGDRVIRRAADLLRPGRVGLRVRQDDEQAQGNKRTRE